jgi:hypothetical protein
LKLPRAIAAEAAVGVGVAVNAAHAIRRFRESGYGDEPSFLRPSERVHDGLRKAGVLEERRGGWKILGLVRFEWGDSGRIAPKGLHDRVELDRPLVLS